MTKTFINEHEKKNNTIQIKRDKIYWLPVLVSKARSKACMSPVHKNCKTEAKFTTLYFCRVIVIRRKITHEKNANSEPPVQGVGRGMAVPDEPREHMASQGLSHQENVAYFLQLWSSAGH